MYDVRKSVGLGHVHSVDIGLAEEWCWCGYNRWQNNFVNAVDLALMTSLDVPSDVLVE